ncbi:superoxide dismutase family protein [Streptosporangium sp. NBC_01639]|uniref:superoxide dismutase family protein n=1 Tax=Streptosporangium sp. NBC_01639 TaxID=2975948 RepID=UPI00386790C8|nr:superoxide dismutase family protein [Streptosporangium sp. NBC_01639]
MPHLALAIALSAGVAGVGGTAAATPTPPPAPPGTSVSPPPEPSGPPEPSTPPGQADSARALIKDVQGNVVGMMRVDSRDGKTRIRVAVRGLPPGFHGFHIHNKGVCDPKSTDPATGSPFFSAGVHLNPGSDSHPGHSGDLPSLLVGKDGAGRATAVTDRFQVRQLLTGNGTSIVIHARPDNQANIPERYGVNGSPGPDAETLKTGDSGARIACGVISAQ